MPNFFNRALLGLTNSLVTRPDVSVARAYGFANTEAARKDFFEKPLERSFGFEGAWYDRTNSNWIAWRSSLDAILRTSIWILVGRCRDLQRTNSIVQRALNLWKNNVVGPHGLRLRVNLRKPDGSPETDLNRTINDQWSYFCCAENLTPAGDMDMVEFQKHLVTLAAIDGTCLVRIFRDPKLPFGIAFRILELDLLDLTKFENRTESDVEIKFGIEKKRDSGKIVAYWLYLTNPNDLSLASNFKAGKSFRVPADEIVLVMKPERPMQTIGVPWFVRAMTNLHILQAYTKATLIKAQMTASYFIFILNDLAVTEGDMGLNGDPNGFQQLPVDNGIALELKRGQKVENVAPPAQAGDMEALFKWTLRFIAGDLNLAYHALSGDLSQSNYSATRIDELEARCGYICEQVWLGGPRAMRPLLREWLKVQLLRQKEIKAPDSDLQRIMYAAQWVGKRWDWIDPKNEAAAELQLINAALKSRTQYLQERGHNLEDHISELEYEQVQMKDSEIVIQTSSGQQLEFGQTDPQQQPAGTAKGGKPSGDGGSDEGEGQGE
jgi:lambda family phage portal protein